MNIADTLIITPTEDPLGYALDWRWQAAQAIVTMAADRSHAPWAQVKDAPLRALVRHLQHRQKNPLREGEKPTDLDSAIAWHSSTAVTLIQALLLAAESYELAAIELALPTESLRLYALLFYDLRDEHGHRRPALLMRIQTELDAQSSADPSVRLLKIALATGIAGLRQVLHAQAPTPAATLEQLVEAELTRRLHAGELRTGDLVRLQANAIARERISLELRRDTPAGLEGLQMMQQVFAMTAPRMVSMEQNQEQLDVSNAAITARLAAQRAVNAVPVADDAGKGVAALTELMGRSFRDKRVCEAK